MSKSSLIKYCHAPLLALCLGVGSASYCHAQVNAEQVTIIGRNVLAMDDYLLAIQYFNQAIKAKPYLSEPYYYRGLAKLMLDDYKGAESDCSEAISRNKFKYEAYRVRGFSRMQNGADSAAVADFNEGLKYAPNDKYFLFYKAVAQSEGKDFAGADSTFTTLLRIYPKFDEGLVARSQMLLLKGDSIAALENADKALSVSKNLINAHLVKADIFAAKEQWDEASNALDEAIKLAPQEPSLYINRAFVRYNRDDWFGAMSDYNYAIDLDPDNRSAVYNRALLCYQVQDIDNALKGFNQILQWDPNNFPARYNRALIYLDRAKYNSALSDFKYIIKLYPRFYQAYFAVAEVYRRMGNEKLSWEYFHKANDITTNYVKNPRKFRLDRPVIEPGKALQVNGKDSEGFKFEGDESELEDQLNRLMTVNENRGAKGEMAYNQKIKGKVQDIDMRGEPQPLYALTYIDTENALRIAANSFRELENLNNGGHLARTIFISNDAGSQNDADESEALFELIATYDQKERNHSMLPLDFFARGLAKAILKDYDGAIADMDKSVVASSDFLSPLMERAYLVIAKEDAMRRIRHNELVEPTSPKSKDDTMAAEAAMTFAYKQAIADLDKVLEMDDRLVYAWYNKGCIYYAIKDYTAALQCFNEATKLNPEFGDAWYNKGVAYLRLGNKAEAKSCLSRAGEKGVLPAYNLLKKLKN